MGTDAEGNLVLIEDRQRAQHLYILGKSGVGKTMLLILIVLQDLLRGAAVVFLDLIGTAVPYLRQCLAAVNLAGLAAERSPYPELNKRLRREREGFLRRVRIVDLDSVETRDRFNPLEPVPGMTTAELAEAFAAAIERMLGGKLSEMRALHLNLVAFASVLIDTGGATILDMVDLCCAGEETLRDYLRRLEKKRAAGRLRIPVRPDLVTRYMAGFFAATAGRERRELSASTLRALALILSDPVAARFLSSPIGNLDLAAALRDGTCILVHLPPQNLHTQTVISSLIFGRLSALAMRRRSDDVLSGRVPQVHVVIDEFQRVFTEEMAADTAVLRNKGVSLILAHQSSNQPPFHTLEGQAMLQSVRDNCSTKVLMRMGPKDAQELAGECFVPRGQMVKRQTEERTQSESLSSGQTVSRAESQSNTESEGRGETQSQTQSISEARGRSISLARGMQTTRTEGHSRTETEGRSEGESTTMTTGRTKGSSRTHTEGRTRSDGSSSSTGHSQSSGWSRNTDSQQSQGQSLAYRDSQALEQFQRSAGQSTGTSTTNSESDSSTESRTHSLGHTHSDAVGTSQSQSRSEAQGRNSTQSHSHSRAVTQSQAQGESLTQTQGQSQTRTLGSSEGSSQSINRSHSHGQTTTQTQAHSESHNLGTSVRQVTEYYSVMEELIVRGYELQNLPNRHAVILLQGNGAGTVHRMQTLDLPLTLVAEVGGLDGLRDLDRLIEPPPTEDEPTLNIFDRLRVQQISSVGEEES